MREIRSALFEERRRARMFAAMWADIGVAMALLQGGETTCQMLELLRCGRAPRMHMVRVIRSIQSLYGRYGWQVAQAS